MPSDDADVIRRFYELSRAGDPACWDLWDAAAVASTPPDFPEHEQWQGLERIKRGFGAWRSVFGPTWWEGVGLDEVTALADGRLIADVTFELAGERSGAPFNKRSAVLYTVRGGRIVAADHFMTRADARAAADA